MNTKNIVVCSTIVACVSFASLHVSTQELAQGFTMAGQDGAARVIENDGVTTAFTFRMPVEAKVVKGAPFSAEIVTESTQTLVDGNRIVQRSNTRMFATAKGVCAARKIAARRAPSSRSPIR
jgi:hypothetical protein